MQEKPRIYLDHAATTPVDPGVLSAMKPYSSAIFGNPNSLHSEGQAAQAALDRAREVIGGAIGARFREIVFTGSATEANNLTLRGVVRRFRERYPDITPRLIVSAIEHESVLETAEDLKRDGVDVVIVPVGSDGRIDCNALERVLNERTALVSVMYANNEIGTVQPIADIARRITAFREAENGRVPRSIDCVYPLFHTDAVQALQWLPCDTRALGVDLMTLSAHKVYGPKGVGALFVKDIGPDHQYIAPILTGGNQEFGMRAGTQNVAGTVGFAAAVMAVAERREEITEKIWGLGEAFMQKLHAVVPGIELNGVAQGLRREDALPNIWNVSFPRHCAKDLVVRFDMEGIAVSAGAACASRAPHRSHVLAALGLSDERVTNGVRFSFGRGTTSREINEAVRRIARCITESVT
jgi:cysteine desulfurase